nr:hypothetical protein [Tanacetum cinerariifolium]
ATGSDEVIKSSVENLVSILSEFEDHLEIVLNSNDDISSSDDNSLHEQNIEYVEASPHDSELVSLEAAKIVIPEVEEIEDDNIRKKLFNVHLLIANIEALKDNPTQSFEPLTKTLVNLPIEDDHSPLLAYVVWIFVTYLTYPVIPPYLYPFGNKDTIFDPDITINHFYSSKPGSSHRHGAFKKFNTHRSHLNEWPMIINGKNTPILDVLLFHFYPP